MRSCKQTRAALLTTLLLLAPGCATIAQKLDQAYTPSTTLYVAPFVDFTEQGGGVDLMVALQNHIYRAAPARFSYVFDEEALCIDGTIHRVEVVAERCLLYTSDAADE